MKFPETGIPDRPQSALQVLPRLTSLNRIVFNLIDLYQPAFASKRLGSGLDLDPVLPLTWIDAPLLERALANLLRSAIKSTRDGSLIFCRTTTDGKWAELTIGESGSQTDARPPQSSDRALAPVSSARLALDTSEAIIAAHGGDVRLLTLEGSGVQFIVRLPAIGLENVRLLEEIEHGRRMQYDLATTLSAELRSPLNVILAYNDLLLDGTFGRLSAEQIEAFHRIGHNGQILLSLIDETLVLPRHEREDGSESSDPLSAAPTPPAERERSAGGIAQWLAMENARLVAALEEAKRLQAEFVTTMSHRLRIPLNTIIGYIDLLLEETFGPLSPSQSGVLRRARKSALQLLDSIKTTLAVDRQPLA